MGMYDTIRCKAKLPTVPPGFVGDGHRFQTKCLDCEMLEYEITKDGRLLRTTHPWDDEGKPLELPVEIPHHGDIFFYTANWRAVVGGEVFTEHGEDYEEVIYRARFTEGRLSSIIEVERERQPARKHESSTDGVK